MSRKSSPENTARENPRSKVGAVIRHCAPKEPGSLPGALDRFLPLGLEVLSAVTPQSLWSRKIRAGPADHSALVASVGLVRSLGRIDCSALRAPAGFWLHFGLCHVAHSRGTRWCSSSDLGYRWSRHVLFKVRYFGEDPKICKAKVNCGGIFCVLICHLPSKTCTLRQRNLRAFVIE